MLYWIQHDVRQTVMGIARHSIAVTHLHKILTEYLHMRRICAHCVPMLLTDQSLRVAALRTFVRRWRAEGDFLYRMITTDGTCILYIQYNAPLHTAATSLSWLVCLGFEQNVHAPYTPDLAPLDYDAFPLQRGHYIVLHNASTCTCM